MSDSKEVVDNLNHGFLKAIQHPSWFFLDRLCHREDGWIRDHPTLQEAVEKLCGEDLADFMCNPESRTVLVVLRGGDMYAHQKPLDDLLRNDSDEWRSETLWLPEDATERTLTEAAFYAYLFLRDEL